jgi:SAM-dependent methyltransferase
MRLLNTAPLNPPERHKRTPARVYDACEIHGNRIAKAREYVGLALALSLNQTRRQPITELGCGTGDISGYYSDVYPCTGIEINPQAVKTARERFPEMSVIQGDARYLLPPDEVGVLVACETLEHLHEPELVLRRWAKNAELLLVSHPIDEDLNSDISAGEHVWSYDIEDFRSWFGKNGFTIYKQEVFKMGLYNLAIGLGVK